jgi:gliding motility-associated-like protein
MKTGISFIFVIFLYAFGMKGQFAVTISTPKVNTCKDTVITFFASATNNGLPVNDVFLTWSFGDGTAPISGDGLDTVKHSYNSGGGYIVRCDAKSGAFSDYALLKIQIGKKPLFSGTKSDRDITLCLGQQLFLTGKFSPVKWKYQLPAQILNNPAHLVNHTTPFQNQVDFRVFEKASVVTSKFTIDTIGIRLEHSRSSDLKIELKCPGGISIVLKDFGGPQKYFGLPVDDESSGLQGTGWDYFWTNSPTFGTMNATLPAGVGYASGSYAPEQPFSDLTGCPLNGQWEIHITDNQTTHNGFVFASQVKFNETILPPSWEFNNTFSSQIWLGNGVSSTSTSGLATAIPQAHGNHKYTFRIKDNFGCFHDTSFVKTVEEVSFTTEPEPPNGDFDLEVKFKNTTKWASNYKWDFGDGSEISKEQNPNHIYKKNGQFKILYTAGTDDGCTDTVSINALISIPKSAFDKMPKVFTPNGDGFNDIYYLDNNALKGIKTLNCKIYSRWGKKVAEWLTVEEAIKGWDGRVFDGALASPGVYYYYIKAEGFDGQVYEDKGVFHLFR